METSWKKRLVFIYNPHAGKGKIKAKLADIVDVFSKADYEVIVYPTKGHLDARDIAERYAREHACDRIVCAGGDGTLAEVTSGVMTSGNQIPLGFIPAGTTNDFAYSLRIPSNVMKAAELAVSGALVPCDIALLNDKPFIYSAAFGLFTDVTYETPQTAKNLMGRLAYLLNGAGKIYNIKSYHLKVEVEDSTIEDDFIIGLIVNSDSIGGFKGITGKNVLLDDGFYEMIFIKMPKSILDLNVIINCLYTGELEESPNIYFKRVAKLSIETDEELPWTLDGEFGGDVRKADITIFKQKMIYIMGNQEC